MNSPITIDGTPVITLVRKRSSLANGLVRPYSLRYTAPPMPSGTAIAVAAAVISERADDGGFHPAALGAACWARCPR